MTSRNDFQGWHYLRPFRGHNVPRYVCSLYVHTDPVPVQDSPGKAVHQLAYAAAAHSRFREGRLSAQCEYGARRPGEFWKSFYDALPKRGTLWVFTHNAGLALTSLRFWDELIGGRAEIGARWVPPGPGETRPTRAVNRARGYAVLQDPPTIVRCLCDGRPVVFVDLLNYVACNYRELAELVGQEPPKALQPDPDDYQLEGYVHASCDLVNEAVSYLLTFWEKLGLGPWAPTAAGLAMSAFRGGFLKPKTVLIHRNQAATHLERLSYYGGRVIVNYRGLVGDHSAGRNGYHAAPQDTPPPPAGPVTVLDCNAMYPWVMSLFASPVRLATFLDRPSTFEVHRLLRKMGAIARVRLHTDVEQFPVRFDQAGAQLFPDQAVSVLDVDPYAVSQTRFAVGDYWTVLAGRELLRAFETNCVLEVGEAAIYEMECIFSRFVDTFHSLRSKARAAGNYAAEVFAKQMLNSLWGKFGQRIGSWQGCPNVPAPIPWGSWVTLDAATGRMEAYRSIAWHTQRQAGKGETDSSAPAIASFVAAAGREVMEWVRSHLMPTQWFYQDTDSLHVNPAGLEILRNRIAMDPFRLGEFKVEGEYADAQYCGPKHYRLGRKWTIAGLKGEATRMTDSLWIQRKRERMEGIAGRPLGAGVKEEETFLHIGLQPGLGAQDVDGWIQPLRL